MGNKITTRMSSDLPGLQWKLSRDCTFIAHKHRQAMKSAKELLTKFDIDSLIISDSLQCGKLTRLLHFIKTGSTFMLLWVSYTQYALR